MAHEVDKSVGRKRELDMENGKVVDADDDEEEDEGNE